MELDEDKQNVIAIISLPSDKNIEGSWFVWKTLQFIANIFASSTWRTLPQVTAIFLGGNPYLARKAAYWAQAVVSVW
ncbi:hypothetical protein O9H85_24555 [Paenibacillus filicis]|uniref:Uncharacterized protein n=1 Tax=Paenibacillus gyeongsangnamensis TaxID=3388067 RepID=A0ABT4QF91_9BACL|nr:hypothetical protein [Paenibacillus filicis]MCZ8515519.1 hypothetical protein [Paenibacillus filicis]